MHITVIHNEEASVCKQMFKQEEAYSLILYNQTTGIQCKLVSVKEVHTMYTQWLSKWYKSVKVKSVLQKTVLWNSGNSMNELE